MANTRFHQAAEEASMKESHWQTCTTPEEMLGVLRDLDSDRLLRLYACACCRLLWQIVPTRHARRAVEVSERFADGWTTPEALQTIRMAAQRVRAPGIWLAAWAAAEAAAPDAWQAAQWAPSWAAEAAAEAAGRLALAARAKAEALGMADAAWHDARREHCAILRDIVGVPRQTAKLHPDWLAWNDGEVVRLAQAIYDDGRFDDLGGLAAVLEEAGCNDPGILGHCRAPSSHVRGCWVLDAVLTRRQPNRGRHRTYRGPHCCGAPLLRSTAMERTRPPAASALRAAG
jgi:hypothetical protein